MSHWAWNYSSINIHTEIEVTNIFISVQFKSCMSIWSSAPLYNTPCVSGALNVVRKQKNTERHSLEHRQLSHSKMIRTQYVKQTLLMFKRLVFFSLQDSHKIMMPADTTTTERLLLCKCVSVANCNLHFAYTVQIDNHIVTKADCRAGCMSVHSSHSSMFSLSIATSSWISQKNVHFDNSSC